MDIGRWCELGWASYGVIASSLHLLKIRYVRYLMAIRCKSSTRDLMEDFEAGQRDVDQL